MPCSICRKGGHNKLSCKEKKELSKDTFDMTSMQNAITLVKDLSKKTNDNYTTDLLRRHYNIHKEYVTQLKKSVIESGIKLRYPSIPEYISENIIKFIIHKIGDKSSNWNIGKGDLHSEKEGKQECKCFTSDGPPSFTPTSDWDVIYFLDARKWLEDKFILHKVNLKRSSDEWKKINVSKTQTFDDQCKQGRRPRITWEYLYPQVSTFCTKVFEGTFEEIFTHTTEPVVQQSALQ